MTRGYRRLTPIFRECPRCSFDGRKNHLLQETVLFADQRSIRDICGSRGCDYVAAVMDEKPAARATAWQVRKWKAVAFILIGLIALGTGITAWAAQ